MLRRFFHLFLHPTEVPKSDLWSVWSVGGDPPKIYYIRYPSFADVVDGDPAGIDRAKQALVAQMKGLTDSKLQQAHAHLQRKEASPIRDEGRKTFLSLVEEEIDRRG